MMGLYTVKVIIVVVIIALAFYYSILKERVEDIIESFTHERRTHSVAPNNLPPKTADYKGGYAEVTGCLNCGEVGHIKDKHPSKPCCECGGEVIKLNGQRKWVIKNGQAYWSE